VSGTVPGGTVPGEPAPGEPAPGGLAAGRAVASVAGGDVGVLASGTGSILEALIDARVPIAVVLVDRPCRAEDVAAGAGLAAVRVERRSYGPDFGREAYTCEVVATLRRHGVRLVAMAGFGTILGRAMFDAFPGAVLNTHPSLLPEFRGWHAVQAALAAGVAVTGCTVHIATEEVDEGPILAQEEVPVRPGDTVEVLHERIKEVERRLYPRTVLEVLARRAAVDLDGPGAPAATPPR